MLTSDAAFAAMLEWPRFWCGRAIPPRMTSSGNRRLNAASLSPKSA